MVVNDISKEVERQCRECGEDPVLVLLVWRMDDRAHLEVEVSGLGGVRANWLTTRHEMISTEYHRVEGRGERCLFQLRKS